MSFYTDSLDFQLIFILCNSKLSSELPSLCSHMNSFSLTIALHVIRNSIALEWVAKAKHLYYDLTLVKPKHKSWMRQSIKMPNADNSCSFPTCFPSKPSNEQIEICLLQSQMTSEWVEKAKNLHCDDESSVDKKEEKSFLVLPPTFLADPISRVVNCESLLMETMRKMSQKSLLLVCWLGQIWNECEVCRT